MLKQLLSKLSGELFDSLQGSGIEPYARLSDSVRGQLGDGVRLITLLTGEEFMTRKPGQRITVVSGKLRLVRTGDVLDLASTQQKLVLTNKAEIRLVADEDAIFLLAEMEFLDTVSSWYELAAYADQIGGKDLSDRLNSVKHTIAFGRLPLEHVIEALEQMTPRKVRAGEDIVVQGERGDAFYLISSGRAEIWKAGIYDEAQQLVAHLGPGDTFGDEALIMGGNRNATVRMVEDGELLVLGETQFRSLMAHPLIEEVLPAKVMNLMQHDWKVLDVRYEEEFEDAHIANAMLLPLHDLRRQADEMLDKSARYVTVCLSGKRSAVAAFLLKQRGYEVVAMKNGMSDWEGETVSGL